MINREFDGLHNEVVTFQVPGKFFGCDQMRRESTKRVLILDDELRCLVNVGTFVMCRKCLQGHLSEGCVRGRILFPCDVDDLGKLYRGRKDTSMRDLVCNLISISQFISDQTYDAL
jgi:hypothetical protein